MCLFQQCHVNAQNQKEHCAKRISIISCINLSYLAKSGKMHQCFARFCYPVGTKKSVFYMFVLTFKTLTKDVSLLQRKSYLLISFHCIAFCTCPSRIFIGRGQFSQEGKRRWCSRRKFFIGGFPRRRGIFREAF